MSDLGRWLLQDKQKELFEFLFAAVLNVVFLALAALVTWALGSTVLALQWAMGYGVLWIVLVAAAVLLAFVQRLFRVDIYSHPNAYVISGLAVSGLIQIAWSAFAALAVEPYAAAASAWAAALLHVFGVLACYVAAMIVSAFFTGTIYRLVNIGLALVAYGIFSFFPTAGRALYFWASSLSISFTSFGSFGVTPLS